MVFQKFPKKEIIKKFILEDFEIQFWIHKNWKKKDKNFTYVLKDFKQSLMKSFSFSFSGFPYSKSSIKGKLFYPTLAFLSNVGRSFVKIVMNYPWCCSSCKGFTKYWFSRKSEIIFVFIHKIKIKLSIWFKFFEFILIH